MTRIRFAVGTLLLCAGCQADLPSQDFIDKLRVLAVRAEPPEVAPGETTKLDVLAVEPITPAPSGILSSTWLACLKAEGVSKSLPCGVEPGSFGDDPTSVVLPPRCTEASGSETCLIGDGLSASYRVPPSFALSADGRGQILLTSVVSDAGSAIDCLVAVSKNGGLPVNPDHCVISIKRLEVSSRDIVTAPNRNPSLSELSLTTPESQRFDLENGSAIYALAPDQGERPTFTLTAGRVPRSAEVKSDGKYEALAASWFSTGGEINGGRSSFELEGCAARSDCGLSDPNPTSTTEWVAPKRAELSTTSNDDGLVRFWAVVRDDRGGVAWRAGTARSEN